MDDRYEDCESYPEDMTDDDEIDEWTGRRMAMLNREFIVRGLILHLEIDANDYRNINDYPEDCSVDLINLALLYHLMCDVFKNIGISSPI